ncbi:hypothetical protein Fcan01_07562 [Folsomia candida]|uniref:GIY-YIG domain-containing protein n=1 Tax=Folsomia candida TaxID=158441 RepID=A0A226EJV9_FOLCA|nr:hypothetical protein Fcan01_07562 [Folsomia candida]
MQYNNNNNSLDEPVKRIILPWAGETTTKIARFLESKLEMKIGYIPGPKLSRMLTNTKEKPRTINCGIYSIQCSNCPAKYIGETGRDYTTRIQEHIHAIRSGNLPVMPPTDDDHVSERFPQVPSSIQSQTRVRQQLYNILKPFGALFRQKYEMMRLPIRTTSEVTLTKNSTLQFLVDYGE